MKFTLDRLMSQLKAFSPQGNGNRENLIGASSICFFTKKTQFINNEILYLGYASDLLTEHSYEGQIPIVCIEDIPVPEQYREQYAVLRLPAETNLHEVNNLIVALLKEDSIEKEYMENLYQSILRDDDICKICDLAKEFVQNPIVVLDISLKHIAESSETQIKDAIWIDQRKNGSFMSSDYMRLLTEQAGYKKDHYSTAPVLLPKGKLKYRRIISHIFLNHHPIGTIVIFEVQRNFQELDLKLVKKLAEVLALHMRNNQFFLYSKGFVYEHLFQDLLEGTISAAELHERIQSQQLQIEEDIYVLVVDISEFDRTYKTLQYFRGILDDIIKNGKSILYNNYIVIVVMRKGGVYLSEKEIENMNHFCEGKKLSAGISKCFHDISMLKAHFEQAVTALNLNWEINKEHRLSSYTEYMIEHMIAIASEKVDLKQFCEESLLKLLEYDATNHTDFAECLHEFLIQERNLAHTSSILHMHRNTLIYRVNRIEEIMEHDLNDANYRFRLLLSFQVLNRLKNKEN